MKNMDLARNYAQLRKIQFKIVRFNKYEGNFLFECINRKSVNYYSEHLASIFFKKIKNLAVWKEIVELYKLFLITAPILQKIKYSYKLDWTRGHFLSLLRMYISKRVNRKYIRVRKIERNINTEHLQNKMLQLGITDRNFINLATDIFLVSYMDKEILRAKLAHCIFDPIVFFGENNGFEFRIRNEFIKMEKFKFQEAKNIDEEPINIWDYKIYRVWDNNLKKTTLKIEINEDYMKKQKEEFKNIIYSKNTPQRKILLIYYKIHEIIETHKYTKDAFDQLLDLKYWLKNRVKGISAQDKRINGIVDMLIEKYTKKLNTKMLFKKPNFFWTPETPKEKIYRYYFSPYREG